MNNADKPNIDSFISKILIKHGDALNTASNTVKVDSLSILSAYLKAFLPGFQNIKIIPGDDIHAACVSITFCINQKFYIPEIHYLKFQYNHANVNCSNSPDDLLEALELALKYDDLGIAIDSCSTVFFKDHPKFCSNFICLFSKGMTASDIIQMALQRSLDIATKENSNEQH